MKKTLLSILAILLVAGAAIAMKPAGETDKSHDAKKVKVPPAPYAQWLIAQATTAHPSVKTVEIVSDVEGVCCTIAASEADEIGELCGGDEGDPMESDSVLVEAPTREDPVYEITFALHDAHGGVVGALSMEIVPGEMNRTQVLDLAETVRADMEAKIDDRSDLFAPAR